MKSRNVALASLLAIGACTTNTETIEILPGGAVAPEDMPVYCVRQAASRFGVEESDIATSAIDRSGGIFTLQGRTPIEGTALHTFQCQFDPGGVFINVVPIRLRS